jgi:hypothetical protein
VVCVSRSKMGVESTELEPQYWLAIDAGATRIRVAPICFSGKAQLCGPVAVENFDSSQGPSRVAQAARLIRAVGEAAGWTPPFRLGLAWAGAPSADGRGTVAARYGPAIPDLVQRLAALVPLEGMPCLHSDARAALEGAALVHQFSSAYALISGSGLGEAYFERGRSWTREEMQENLGRAANWEFRGRDGESWLRASAWRNQRPRPYQEALQALVSHRLQRIQPEVLALGGHFGEWFERGWVHGEMFQPRLLRLEPETALLGCVQMERRRIQTA